MIISKNFIIVLLAGIIAALILFNGNCKKPVKPVVIPVKEQVKTVEDNEAKIQPIVDSLENVVTDLKIREVVLVKTLASTQAENRKLSKFIKTAEAIANGEGVTPDTSSSYPELVNALIRNSEIADSMCNETVYNLQGQVKAQAQTIVLKDSAYGMLRTSFNTAMVQQNILADYNKQLNKQLKKKQVASFIWKGAALVGGIFILKSAIK